MDPELADTSKLSPRHQGKYFLYQGGKKGKFCGVFFFTVSYIIKSSGTSLAQVYFHFNLKSCMFHNISILKSYLQEKTIS